ncbi:DUF4190 domain-containing protein [Kitasatospora sp. LaBMicrA B282]|uniref:DUF4190 domain-containing protein n=1 Tax=Kitasatospora sp. LaBMicrA B282 TaxID=3420949 RepID=UPI003D10653B
MADGDADAWAPPGGGPPLGDGPQPPFAPPYGSPYPPPSYPPRAPDGRPVVEGSNGLAIASLVTGVTCCLWPAALGLGIGALVQLRRRHQRGRGLAVAGVLLGLLGLAASVTGLLTGSFHVHVGGGGAGAAAQPAAGATAGPSTPDSAQGSAPRPTGIFAWQPGTCFTETTDHAGHRHHAATSCTSPHWGEVTARVTMPGSTYPGTEAAIRQAHALCSDAKTDYITDLWAIPRTVEVHDIYPEDATAWAGGGHSALCYLYDRAADGRAIGSLRRDGSNLSPDQQALLKDLYSLDELEPEFAKPQTDPEYVGYRSQGVSQVLSGVVATLGQDQWSAGSKDRIAALVAALKADQSAWTAAADTTADPLGAYRAALQNDNPVAAETIARRALGLTDHDLRNDPTPPPPPSTPPTQPADGGSADAV